MVNELENGYLGGAKGNVPLASLEPYGQWKDVLMKVQLFDTLEWEELNNIITCLRPAVKYYKKKENITIQSDDFYAIGIVLEGQVIITKDTLAGDRIIMNRSGKGSLFGEIAAFSNKKWPATVIAETDCAILFFPPKKIIGICTNMCSGHRVLIENMLKIVSEKAFMLNKKVEILSLKSIRKKVTSYLLEHYMMNQKLSFQIPLQRNELAEFLSVTRPSLSRELINMQGEGLIDFYKNSFKILDLERLKEQL